MAQRSPEERQVGRSEFRTYNWTPTTFVKREIPISERYKRKSDGLPIDDPRLAARFFNEAAAYKLLKENTTIPVPQLLSYGYDTNGHLYIEMERVSGSVQASIAADECRMPDIHLPVVDAGSESGPGPCSQCREIVRNNVAAFVHGTVLPQLRGLKSNSTGLNGYVMPPLWVIDQDDRLEWPVKTSPTDDFVFVLHDLVEHNILLDTRTLEVRALVDLEDSGFFPPEMQEWRETRLGQFDIYDDKELVKRHIRLLEY